MAEVVFSICVVVVFHRVCSDRNLQWAPMRSLWLPTGQRRFRGIELVNASGAVSIVL